MQLPADYHMHTPLCRHAVGEPDQYATRAQELGITEIGFSDHSPMERDGFDDWRMNFGDLRTYIDIVSKTRAKYPNLDIKIAMEVDFLPGHESWIRRLADMHPWDYLIGSVHYIEDWALDNPQTLVQWERRDTFEIWSAYFDRLTMAAESGLFDIIGHADLCKKFGSYPKQDCAPLYERFLKAAAKSGTAIELNTAGLRKECKEIYPSLGLLRMARSAGVPITFGSDSHDPADVGYAFAEAIAQARAAGYTHWMRFEKRKAVKVSLG